MNLENFRNAVRIRTQLPHNDENYIPTVAFPRIMDAAEREFAISNQVLYGDDTKLFIPKLFEKVSIFGSFCGWAEANGTVHGFGYACHENFRYWFTPDNHEAEQTMAHISTSNHDIEDMMSNIHEYKYKTKRMVRGILTFCHSVNENVFWHEELLKHFYYTSKGHLNGMLDPGEPQATMAELSDYLHKTLPKHFNRIPMTRPYGYLEGVIKLTNDNAHHVHHIIKPYSDQEMQAKFNVRRMMGDRSEARYYADDTNLTIGEFQQRLARLGY